MENTVNNEYSAENLYNLGSSENKLRTTRSDNDIDIITKELRSSESFIDHITFSESVYQKNVSDKMNMLNRINANYGKCNRGIEGFCNELSLEDSSENKLSKKTGFFTKMLAGIIKFFKRVWSFIIRLLKRFKGFIHNLFNKKNKSDNNPREKDLEQEDKKEPDPVKPTFTLDFSKNANTSKFSKYVDDFTNFMGSAGRINVEIRKIFDNKMDKNPDVRKRMLEVILPAIKIGERLYKIPGFDVKFDISIGGNNYKVEDLQKSITNIEKIFHFHQMMNLQNIKLLNT